MTERETETETEREKRVFQHITHTFRSLSLTHTLSLSLSLRCLCGGRATRAARPSAWTPSRSTLSRRLAHTSQGAAERRQSRRRVVPSSDRARPPRDAFASYAREPRARGARSAVRVAQRTDHRQFLALAVDDAREQHRRAQHDEPLDPSRA